MPVLTGVEGVLSCLVHGMLAGFFKKVHIFDVFFLYLFPYLLHSQLEKCHFQALCSLPHALAGH